METTLVVAISLLVACLGMIGIGSLRSPGGTKPPMRTLYLVFVSMIVGAFVARGSLRTIMESVLLAAAFASLVIDVRGNLNPWRGDRAPPRRG